MRTLYLDLGMGAAGDMLGAALYELLDEAQKKDFLEELNNAGIPGVNLQAEKSVKCGITGTHFKVTVDGKEEESADGHGDGCHEHGHDVHAHHEHHEHGHDEHEHHDHHHSSMAEIKGIIENLHVAPSVKEDIIATYTLIAGAESNVHGVPVTDIHFHEVGTMDAVADITAVCLLMRRTGADKVYASPVHVGSGQVRCAHGLLPVPAPATALILKGIPTYGGQIAGELCTPTGAALLRHFVTEFGPMPPMRLSAIGYGMGKKDFEAANCVRAMLGECADKTEQVLEYTCNLDDISAEKLAFATERLFEAGAIEVYTVPVGMKKSRPGNLLCVMCREADREKILTTLFKHTTTLGVRENVSRRYFLDRHTETLETEFGSVRVKKSEGYGTKREKYEYEDLARIAKEHDMSIQEVESRISRA